MIIINYFYIKVSDENITLSAGLFNVENILINNNTTKPYWDINLSQSNTWPLHTDCTALNNKNGVIDFQGK